MVELASQKYFYNFQPFSFRKSVYILRGGVLLMIFKYDGNTNSLYPSSSVGCILISAPWQFFIFARTTDHVLMARTR